MYGKILVLISLPFLFNCSGIIREVLNTECLRSIESKLAETTYTFDYVKDQDGWYFLNENEEKELFEKAKVEECSGKSNSLAEKYQIGLKKTGQHSFEVKVQLQSN